MIVTDAGVVVLALTVDSPGGDEARRRLDGEELSAPHLIDLEVISAWRRMNRTGDLTDRRCRAAVADLRALPLDRVPHSPLLDRCWELRENLTTYDAAYVALAEILGVRLLTADRRLANAPGVRCPVEVLTS